MFNAVQTGLLSSPMRIIATFSVISVSLSSFVLLISAVLTVLLLQASTMTDNKLKQTVHESDKLSKRVS